MSTKFSRLNHQQVISDYLECYDINIVSSKHNVSNPLIYKILIKYNIPTISPKRPDIPEDIIVKTYLKLKSVTETRKKLKIGFHKVKRALDNNNIEIIHRRRYLIGEKIGKLQILENNSGKIKCKCDCGNMYIISNKVLYTKKDCGCVKKINNIRDSLKKYNLLTDENINLLNQHQYKELRRKINNKKRKISRKPTHNENRIKKILTPIKNSVNLGILPKNKNEYTTEQKQIYRDIITNLPPKRELVRKYIDLCYDEVKQKKLLTKIKINSYSPKSGRRAIFIDPNLSPADIIINEYCPFFGTKLTHQTQCRGDRMKMKKYIASVDRIDSAKGYVKGNIWTTSLFANMMKQDATINELLIFSENILKNHIT